eukprot:5863992-Pleurochrysis_carterae.AAC.2
MAFAGLYGFPASLDTTDEEVCTLRSQSCTNYPNPHSSAIHTRTACSSIVRTLRSSTWCRVEAKTMVCCPLSRTRESTMSRPANLSWLRTCSVGTGKDKMTRTNQVSTRFTWSLLESRASFKGSKYKVGAAVLLWPFSANLR